MSWGLMVDHVSIDQWVFIQRSYRHFESLMSLWKIHLRHLTVLMKQVIFT